jgi:putative transposase
MKYNPLIHNRRSIRLKGYDYSQAGAYFITICTNQRQPLFGEILNGEMILSEIGQIAYNEWLKTPEIRPYVSLDVFAIMPNHMHGIILINDDPTIRRGVSHTPLSGALSDGGGKGLMRYAPTRIISFAIT